MGYFEYLKKCWCITICFLTKVYCWEVKVQDKSKANISIALTTLYIAWSSTYLAIRFALESYPPFFTAGFRYMLVGASMYVYLRIKGESSPTRQQWLSSTIIGTFLILGGTGGVVIALQWVGTGTAALVIATTPLWTVLFAGIWRQWPVRYEWLGLACGFTGIILLNLDGDLHANPTGAALLIMAAASWSFGSMLSLRLALPSSMMASATQMFTGGLLILTVGILAGERFPIHPSNRATLALAYLALFGSLLGYTAYTYLLKNVRPALATSYAYVNPVLAVLLGIWVANERITTTGVFAMLAILTGVILIIVGPKIQYDT